MLYMYSTSFFEKLVFFFVFLDENEHICLKKFVRLVRKQCLEFKILPNTTVDFSYLHSLISLIISYIIVIYQMIEN